MEFPVHVAVLASGEIRGMFSATCAGKYQDRDVDLCFR
jgi:hypothetical protein